MNDTNDVIVCKGCGAEVARFTGSRYYPDNWDKDMCSLCNWVNSNRHLTEGEREELRERFGLRRHKT
jgi:hypothetical protein